MNTHFKKIEIESWKRCELFKSFQTFHSPTINVCVELNVRPLYDFAHANKTSFFLLTLFAISKAMNSIPEFRQRFLDKTTIAEYDIVHPSTPIMKENNDYYAQTQLEYFPTFFEFEKNAKPIIENAKKAKQNDLLTGAPNCFGASCVPWMCATASTTALYQLNQDMPLITWFKMNDAGKIMLSLYCNHSFLDGFHISQFFNTIENAFKHPENL